jgi:hypothetical protein
MLNATGAPVYGRVDNNADPAAVLLALSNLIGVTGSELR